MNGEFLKKLSELSEQSSVIKEELYNKYSVKRGLRNEDFTGVLVGLTHVGDVRGYDKVDGKAQPIDGRLAYSGVDVFDLVKGFQADNRHGFGETAFLLLCG
ncbi:MAG: citrate synthase, partial [Candidatus Woesearchaeota archaeon]|nr:citrate synthase [Candidatus Woesearchaeota archaeon]